jgi:hypothetical protein
MPATPKMKFYLNRVTPTKVSGTKATGLNSCH